MYLLEILGGPLSATAAGVAMALGLIASNCTKDSTLKILLAASSLAFAWHYYLLGALVAACLALVSCLRNAVSIFNTSSKLAWSFVAIYVATGIMTMENWIDALPVIASSITTVAVFYFNGVHLRAIILTAGLGWAAYQFTYGAIIPLIYSLTFMASNLLSIVRIRHEDKATEKHLRTDP